jgi:hypothetical protein
MQAAVTGARELGPSTGAALPLVAHVLSCAGWPTPVTNPPAPLPDGLPPLLGLGTWTDFPGTERLVRLVPGSVAIFHGGPGHVIHRPDNPCATDAVDRYLVELELPPPGTVC